jgi:hypothetical protein
MNFFTLNRKYVFTVVLLLSITELVASVPNTCPVLTKRNNGNGQATSCSGESGFPVPAYVSAPYNSLAGLGVTTAQKTGDFNFVWHNQLWTQMPVIRRVWVGSTLTNTVVGPPKAHWVQNGNTYTSYCFYKYNLPNQGTLTLEFVHPTTLAPLFICCFNLSTSAACTPSVVCSPTITTQPSSKTVCGTSTTFSVEASGVSSYQWQMKPPSGSFANITNGGDFSGATTSTLSINSNLSTYNGYQFQAVLTGAGTCGNTTSSIATLTAYPKPTASFNAGAIVCGVGTYNLRVDFTGTGPWSFTYTTNGGSPTTVSNITVNPYYLAVSPATTTTYAITAINDRYCNNDISASPVTIVVQDKPTITLTSSAISYCYSASAGSASLPFTATTQSPSQYSITAGTRAMSGFTAVSNATLPSSPISINVPAGITAGIYDFNLRVKVASPGSGCESDIVTFTIEVKAAPPITVTASAASVCPGGNVNLLASPNLGGGVYLCLDKLSCRFYIFNLFTFGNS